MPTGTPRDPERAAARGRTTWARKRKAQREHERPAVHGEDLGPSWWRRAVIDGVLDEVLDEIVAKRKRTLLEGVKQNAGA